MLRSAMMAGVIALCCVGVSQPADAQMHGSFSGWHGGFNGGRFHHDGFRGNRFFFGFGFGGYPYYPYYPAYYYPAYYYPPYYPYPYYPPYAGYPGGYPAAGPGGYGSGGYGSGGYGSGGYGSGGYSGTAGPSATSAFDPATVREVQAELQRRGFNVGPVDGRLGPRTKGAIRDYERQNGLPVDGMPSPSLRNHLQQQPAG